MKHPETAFSRAMAALVISCAVILMVVASSAAVVSARTADRADSHVTSWALSAPASQVAVPLIPRRVLMGNPDKAAPSISPDGKELAFLASVNGVL